MYIGIDCLFFFAALHLVSGLDFPINWLSTFHYLQILTLNSLLLNLFSTIGSGMRSESRKFFDYQISRSFEIKVEIVNMIAGVTRKLISHLY